MRIFNPVIDVVASGLRFPEGPVVLPDGSILVAEIAGRCVTKVDAQGHKEVIAKIEGAPNGLAIGPDGACYICNNGGRVFAERDGITAPLGLCPDYRGGSIDRLDLATGAVETLYRESRGVKLRSPNDLAIDANGNIWFSDFGLASGWTMDRGAIFHARADGSAIERQVFPLLGPNGVGLSPDERRLYVSETHTGRTWWFDLQEPGVVAKSADALLAGKGHLLAGLPGFQVLDSLAVDSEGWVAVATMTNGAKDKGGITAISPDGTQLEYYPMPDPHTTNLAFGGPDGRSAYATLSSSGKLVRFDWPRQGMAQHHLST